MSEMTQALDWAPVARLLVVVLDGSDPAAAQGMIAAALPWVTTGAVMAEAAGTGRWRYGNAVSSPTSLIPQLQRQGFDAAIVLTAPGQSPYAAAYLCYLTNIPIRIGQSREFGGGVLSLALPPPDVSPGPPRHPHSLLQRCLPLPVL